MFTGRTYPTLHKNRLGGIRIGQQVPILVANTAKTRIVVQSIILTATMHGTGLITTIATVNVIRQNALNRALDRSRNLMAINQQTIRGRSRATKRLQTPLVLLLVTTARSL